jgi:ribonuclease Z
MQSHERFFLIDCGEGTQMQLRKHKIKLGRLDHILISHLHGDHTFGLFGLLSSLNLMGRTAALVLFGPPELKHILDLNFDMFDIHLNYPLEFRAIQKGRTERLYEDKWITIDSFPVKHRIPTSGFLFREKPRPRNLIREAIEHYQIPIKDRPHIKNGADFTTADGRVIPNTQLTRDPSPPRSFAFCSDTVFNRNMISKIKGVDLLYHEATFMEDEAERARETFHSTAKQAAQIALEANVKKLILGHFSARYKDLDPLLEEARSVFPRTCLAEDGTTYDVVR